MIRIKGKIRRVANSYVFTIPKPYVDGGNLIEGEEYEILISASSPGVMVRFLVHVPRFVGKDLRLFGPFAEGETAMLPVDTARILINKGIVKCDRR